MSSNIQDALYDVGVVKRTDASAVHIHWLQRFHFQRTKARCHDVFTGIVIGLGYGTLAPASPNSTAALVPGRGHEARVRILATHVHIPSRYGK